jgi:hypothetical protein
LPSEAEIIPLPSEEVTPPVTKIYLAEEDMGTLGFFGCKGRGFGVCSFRSFGIISFFGI